MSEQYSSPNRIIRALLQLHGVEVPAERLLRDTSAADCVQVWEDCKTPRAKRKGKIPLDKNPYTG